MTTAFILSHGRSNTVYVTPMLTYFVARRLLPLTWSIPVITASVIPGAADAEKKARLFDCKVQSRHV